MEVRGTTFTITLAQISAIKHDVASNIQKHCDFIRKAGEHASDYVVFPELSLTGYEPETAKQLAFSINDERLTELKNHCQTYGVNAVIGAPIQTKTGIIIGSFIILKDGSTLLYSKHHLHPGEEIYFISGNLNPMISDCGENMSFAICADTNHPIHRKLAYENNASLYIASVMITPNGYLKDTNVLQQMAKDCRMTVFMANYCGQTGGYEAAGGSSVWNADGQIIGKLDSHSEGLLIVSHDEENNWYLKEKIYL